MLKYSKSDSESNSFNVYRSNLQDFNADIIVQEIIENNVDIAILRIPAKYVGDLWELNMGYNYVVADCLVEYTYKINKNKPEPVFNPMIEYVPVNTDNESDVYTLLEQTFSNYSNHYTSNPFLKTELFFESYKNWINDCMNGNGLVYLVKYDGQNAAFFSGKIENNCFILGLGGVHSNFEGCGIYLDAVKRLPYIGASKGAKISRTGTQIQNHVVQKQWNTAGWVLSYSWVTIHINAFLNRCHTGERIRVDAPVKLDLIWVMHQLQTNLQYSIIDSNVKFYKNLFEKFIDMFISPPIPNYRNLGEALVTIKFVNDEGAILCISQITVNNVN